MLDLKKGHADTNGGRMTTDERPQVLTVPEVAEILRVGRNLVYRMIERGEIPAIRVGRKIRVPRLALDRYLDRSTQDYASGERSIG